MHLGSTIWSAMFGNGALTFYDPEEYGTYRIFRGGGWNDPERHCPLTNRRRSHPTYAIDDLGFRLARSI